MMVTYAVCVIKYPEDTHVFPREDEGRPFRRKRTCFRKRGTDTQESAAARKPPEVKLSKGSFTSGGKGVLGKKSTH